LLQLTSAKNHPTALHKKQARKLINRTRYNGRL